MFVSGLFGLARPTTCGKINSATTLLPTPTPTSTSTTMAQLKNPSKQGAKRTRGTSRYCEMNVVLRESTFYRAFSSREVLPCSLQCPLRSGMVLRTHHPPPAHLQPTSSSTTVLSNSIILPFAPRLTIHLFDPDTQIIFYIHKKQRVCVRAAGFSTVCSTGG